MDDPFAKVPLSRRKFVAQLAGGIFSSATLLSFPPVAEAQAASPTPTPSFTPTPTPSLASFPSPTPTPSFTPTPTPVFDVTPTPTPSFGPFPTPTPSPSAGSSGRLGDVNGDGFVTSVDALNVLRIVAGLPSTAACPIPPPGNPNVALNENPGDPPTSVDALCILRGVAGLPGTDVCPFITAPVVEPGRATLPSAGSTAELRLAAETLPRSGNQRTTVRVQAKALHGRLGAWTLDVLYDPMALKILACTPADGSFCNPTFAKGTVRISGASASGFAGERTLATLSVEGIGGGGHSSTLRVAARTLTNTEGHALATSPSTAEV